MSVLSDTLAQMGLARTYSLDLLSHIPDEAWFRMPSEGVTHVAWQAGHLAVAEYGLALKRIRGEQPGDEELLPARFFELFGKGSVPVPDASKYPSCDEIRAVMDRVHQQALSELSDLPLSVLDEPPGPSPHPMFQTKLGALRFCAHHEFLHAGQIGLLRRLIGLQPLR